MKFLTIRQPWAQLIAVGAKTIETRPFSTKYRGPLAIHAGKARPECSQWEDGPFDDITDRFQYGAGSTWHSGSGRCVVDDDSWWLQEIATDTVHDMPLGAVVAVCDLVDVVPIVPTWPNITTACLYPGYQHTDRPEGYGSPTYWDGTVNKPGVDVADQLPFGDFTPGRFAWLLGNVRPLDHPVPMKGAQGLRDLPADVEDILAVRWAIGGGA